MNNAALNIRVHISLWINVFNFFLVGNQRRIAGSYGNSSLNFLRNLRTVFHSDDTNLYFYPQCMGVLFSLRPLPHLLLLVLSMIVILIGVKWYLIVVLICISLLASEVEHLFMFFGHRMSSWEKFLYL